MSQLENWVEKVTLSDVPKVFIDHHAPHPEIMQLSTIYLVNEDATSTCEIVYELYKNFGVKPSASVAKALLTGIAFDSKHFKIGTSKSFEAISELLEIDGNAQEIIGLISSERSRSERIARLKAGQRLQLYEIEGWIVVTSHVSSFQASAARSLLALGADVAIVAGGENGVVKVSLRSTFRYYRESSIHLGVDVARPLGEQFDGSGSGHTTAAGVNAKGMYKHILNRAVELLVSSHK
jgi:nanoRNase/pAp phosphatase (c-di-AMP/oligoRNAs hydrolase)